VMNRLTWIHVCTARGLPLAICLRVDICNERDPGIGKQEGDVMFQWKEIVGCDEIYSDSLSRAPPPKN